jgi:hypothetical protein
VEAGQGKKYWNNETDKLPHSVRLMICKNKGWI